jgi:predicted nucleotidyltransferase
MSKLTSLLCERRDVRLAVVYGSCARGDDRPESELDLLVSFTGEEAHTAASLAVALTEKVGRPLRCDEREIQRQAAAVDAELDRRIYELAALVGRQAS